MPSPPSPRMTISLALPGVCRGPKNRVSWLALEDANGGIPDAFEVSLLDPSLHSVVPTFRDNATSFFNANPGNQTSLASGVTFDGTRVTVDISTVPPGTEVTLFFDLIGNPPGNGSVVVLDNVAIIPETMLQETFTRVPLPGPFDTLAGIGHCDQNGDDHVDLIVNDVGLGQFLVFLGDGSGNFSGAAAPPLLVQSADQMSLSTMQTTDSGSEGDLGAPATAALTAAPTTIGDVISGSIDNAGESDTFEFNGTSGQIVFFDVLAGSVSSFSWAAVCFKSGWPFKTLDSPKIPHRRAPSSYLHPSE